MRYSIRAALTTLLVGILVSFLTNHPGFGAIAAVAVMGVYIIEATETCRFSKEPPPEKHTDA